MTKGLWRNPAFWAIAVSLATLGLYVSFAVFGVQTLFYDTEVNEDLFRRADSAAAGDPVVISSGKFHAVAHPGTGAAIVYRLEDGSHVLRLENLDIFNGPALYVYAVAASDADDSETVLEADSLNWGRSRATGATRPTGCQPNLIPTGTARSPSGASGFRSTSPRRL